MSARRKKPPSGQRPRLAWSLFLVLGLPLGFMAALYPLATSGIYIEPLRQFWRPWPSDTLKTFIGVAGFVATLAYLSYRIGRNAGFRRGTVAAAAAARNLAEGRPSSLAQTMVQDTAPAHAEPPTPPPQ